MAIRTYQTGTASVLAGGTTVAGAGVIWSGGNAREGDEFVIGGVRALILEVLSATELKITPWQGDNESGAAYTIYQTSSRRFDDVQIADDLQKQVSALNTDGFYHFVKSSEAAPDPSLGDEGQYAFQAATGKLWLKEGGVWIYVGVFKGINPRGPWDSATDYTANDLVSYGGSSYLALAASTNDAPPSANWMLVAEKGEAGGTGAPGTNGTNGIDGAAATIEIGTVTTVPYGTPASVTNVGDENAAILDIEIPAGQDGTGTGDMQAANNLSDLANADTALDNLGGTAVGKAVFTAADQAAARAAIAAPPSDLSNISFAVSANAGALTVALKDGAGNDPSPTNPIAVNFRSATQTSGLRSLLTLTAAQSIEVLPGRTLGFQNATAGRIWITGWDDGGTFRLGVFNASDALNVYPLSEESIATTTDLVGAANSPGVHYTRGVAVVSKAFRILGYVEWNASGLTTAGTWTTTNLASIQTFGPGVRKPGDVVQRLSVIGSGASHLSTTSSSYQDHPTLTLSPSLKSAANLVKAAAVSVGKQTVASAGCWMRVLRSGVVSVGETLGQDNTSAAATYPVLCGGGFDKPNSLAPTYKVQGRCNINGQTITLGEYGRSSLDLEEIQG